MLKARFSSGCDAKSRSLRGRRVAEEAIKAAVMCEDVARTSFLATRLGSQCPSTPRISPGSTDATPLSTANSSSMTRNGGTVAGRPKIGLLGIMQALYDEMLPGITERQAGYAKEVAIHLKGVAEGIVPGPAKSRAEIEDIVEGFEKKLDGVMIVMLTYGPAMRATRALSETRLPLMLANIQPEPVVTPEWDMGDMTYNQGVHGAQDTANALVRSGVPFEVVTADWRSEAFKVAFEDWARAAAAVSAWRRLRVAIFGYAMNGMGDIRVDETDMLRELGPEINFLATGDLHRAMQSVSEDEIEVVLEEENRLFEVDKRLDEGASGRRPHAGRHQEGARRRWLRCVLHALRCHR